MTIACVEVCCALHQTQTEQKHQVALLGLYLRYRVHKCGRNGCYISVHILGRAVAQLSGQYRGNFGGMGHLEDTRRVNIGKI